VTNLKALHASCILSSNERTKFAGTGRRGFSEVGRPSPAVPSCRINTRDLRALVVLIKVSIRIKPPAKATPLNCMITACVIFLAVARFVLLGKASFHALEGFSNLFRFVFPAHAKLF
jgi:hypothetical protein